MNKLNYNDYNDSELFMMINEANEDAKDIIYKKYHYIIDICIKKYAALGKSLGIEYKDLYQEALLGFTDAVNKYDENKEASLATFITLCVERKLQTIIRNNNTNKSKFFNESLSLEEIIENNNHLIKNITEIDKNDPLYTITSQEDINELLTEIKGILSKQEYEVFNLLRKGLNIKEISIILNKEYKQVENTRHRLRNKIRKLLENNK